MARAQPRTVAPGAQWFRRLLIVLAVGSTIYAIGCLIAQPSKVALREKDWIRYARSGDRVWGEFRVHGLKPFQDGYGNWYLDVSLKPLRDPPAEPPIEFRIPEEAPGKEIQWLGKFRFRIEAIQRDVIKLDRQNVVQIVTYR